MRIYYLYSVIVLNFILIQSSDCFGVVRSSHSKGPLNFGKDIVAHFDPEFADRDCDIAVAFNGWIYIAYSTSHSSPSGTDIGIALSKDSGLTWQAFPPKILGSHNDASVYDMIVTGSDTSSLRVYISYSFYDVSFPYAFGHVAAYDGVSGLELPYGLIIGDGTYSVGKIRLASDFKHPAFGSIGYSVAVVYTTSIGDFTVTDSLVCLIASDTSRNYYSYNLADTSSIVSLRDASIDYGFSLAWNNGQYFIAYQRGLYLGYCKNSTSINSGFNTPILLNEFIGLRSASFDSPQIICQSSLSNNDSSGLSVLIMTKALDSSGMNTYRIPWIIYNQQASLSDFWFSAGIANSHNGFTLETFDACYSEAEDRFFFTGYNSDLGSLFMGMEDFNFSHPDNWLIVENHYNDSLIDPSWPPNPRIATNNGNAYTTWESRILGSIGQPRAQTLFDRQTLPILTNLQTRNENSEFNIFPNPASNELFILETSVFNSAQEISVRIFDSLGRIVFSGSYCSQMQTITINTQEFKNGIYFLQIDDKNRIQMNGKVLILHQ